MERALGIELRKLSNLTCRYFDQQTNKRAVDAVTGTNGWIIGYIARREKEGREVYQRDLETRFGICLLYTSSCAMNCSPDTMSPKNAGYRKAPRSFNL